MTSPQAPNPNGAAGNAARPAAAAPPNNPDMVAKSGPSPADFDEAKNETQSTTLVMLLFKRTMNQGGILNVMTKEMRRQSAQIIFSKSLQITLSNSNQYQTQVLFWKVSVGSSAHRIASTYTKNGSVPGHDHGWGVFASRMNAANALSNSYQGQRTPGGGGALTHLNAKEADNQAQTLMDGLGFMEGIRVNTTHIWYKVFYNVAQLALARLDGDDFERPTWRTRPKNPLWCEHVINGLNHYVAHMGNLMVGHEVTIELDSGEKHLIPYLNYLMGGSDITFNWRWGDHGGNDRAPHLTAKIPVDFNFGYVIRDNLDSQVMPINVPTDQALPGLPAAIPIVAGMVVEAWNQDLLRQCMSALARSMAVASDCEAAAIKVAIDVFAEPFRGVGPDEICGANRLNGGHNAFLDIGTARLPAGSTGCSFATRITEKNPATLAAIDRANCSFFFIYSVQGLRSLAETFILAMQLANRQLGVTTAISYGGLPQADVYDPNVPPQQFSAPGMSALQSNFCKAHLNNPSQTMLMTSMVASVIYQAVLPETALYFDYGTMSVDALCPTWNITNLGECMTSVHAGQIQSGMLTSAAIGMAGIPNKMDQLASEAPVQHAGVGGATIAGTSNSDIDDGTVESLPGVYMLGHASIFTYDDGLAAGDEFIIEVSGFQDRVRTARAIRSIGVVMNTRTFVAYAIRAAFTGPATHLRALTLYADFDLQRYADLRLVLPNSAHTCTYSDHPGARSRLPGYVSAMIANSIGAMTGSVGLRLTNRSTKRAKIIAANAVAARKDTPENHKDGADN